MAETATIHMPAAQSHRGAADAVPRVGSDALVSPGLLERLMHTALEHAAAQRGVLVVLRERAPWIEAEARAAEGGMEVTARSAPLGAGDLPVSVLSQVLRTREPLVLDGASLEQFDPGDAYARKNRPPSLMCLPIQGEADVLGALYLESRATTPALCASRLATLDLVASQAALAIENARLRRDLRHSQSRCAEAERLSLTGSFCWSMPSETFELSAQASRLLDLDPAGAVSLDAVASRIHPEDFALLREMVESARMRVGHLDCVCRARMRDQSVRQLRLVAHLARDEEGHAAYVGAVQDVTQALRAEEALDKARSELAHLARVTTMGALAASITHELNQPLAGIVTNGSACLRMLATEPANLTGARETVRRTIRDGHRAADVIARLRALFTKGGCTQGAVDLNAAAREVMALSHREIEHAGVVLRSELGDDLPSVAGDRIQLEQVILNLLLNACEAMVGITDRPRQLTIATAVDGEDQVTLSVRDTGPGVPAEGADKLFEAFYTTKKGGMGIGLSVSRSIIESHRGRLWVSPNQGPGATFSFALPRSPDRPRTGAARTRSQELWAQPVLTTG